MKTVEEKANEKYYDIPYPEDIASVDDYTTNEIRLLQRIAYVAGYSEAMLWRDPNIELPDYYKKVLVKYERDDLKIDYACVSRLADDDGAYFFGDYRFDIVIDFDKVIGWRPIE